MTHDHLASIALATVASIAGAAWGFFAPAVAQDAGVISEVLKAAPSTVSTVLVIVVVWAFLKHERARDRDFREMLTEQRAEHIANLERTSERANETMQRVADNLSHLSEGQTRVLEAIHGCLRGRIGE